jgi:hypothetical protein
MFHGFEFFITSYKPLQIFLCSSGHVSLINIFSKSLRLCFTRSRFYVSYTVQMRKKINTPRLFPKLQNTYCTKIFKLRLLQVFHMNMTRTLEILIGLLFHLENSSTTTFYCFCGNNLPQIPPMAIITLFSCITVENIPSPHIQG